MSTLSELIYYCKEDDPVGALLLLGEWGCGGHAYHNQNITVRHEQSEGASG